MRPEKAVAKKAKVDADSTPRTVEQAEERRKVGARHKLRKKIAGRKGG